jgi:hypothetical protein
LSRQVIRRNGEKAEEALINYGKAVREKIEQKRTEILYQEQSECIFRPSISRKSERMMNEKYNGTEYRPGVDKFYNLYEDAKRRKER